MSDVGATEEASDRAEVARVGAEPTVAWTRDENSGLPRFHIMAPGWTFFDGRGYMRLGEGAAMHGTVTHVGYEPLVPSDGEPDIENGIVWIAGHTLMDLRAIHAARGEGWVSVRARLRWLWRRWVPLLRSWRWRRDRRISAC